MKNKHKIAFIAAELTLWAKVGGAGRCCGNPAKKYKKHGCKIKL